MLTRDSAYTFGYLVVLGLGVLTTAIAFRPFGALTLEWIAGAMLALGWGSSAVGLLAPRLSSDIWSVPVNRTLWPALRCVIFVAVILAVASVVPAFSDIIDTACGLTIEYWRPLVAIGVFRGLSQVLTTLAIRAADHLRTIAIQFIARIAEIAFVLHALLDSNSTQFMMAWLVFPAAQMVFIAARWRHYARLQQPNAGSRATQAGHMATLTILASSLVDMILPSLWLRLSNAHTYIIYRAMMAAISNAVLVPRYWYTVASVNKGSGLQLVAFTTIASLVLSIGYLFVAHQLHQPADVLFVLPLIVNSLGAAELSRLRQAALLAGMVEIPAFAMLIGVTFEALLLALLAYLAPGPIAILAFSSMLVNFIAMRYLARARGLS